MVLHPAKLTGISVLFMLGLGSSHVQAEAEVRTDTDYIAIVIEAEDYSTREDRWILTDATTPAQEQDPDGNHSDGAVGGVYLELLPDVRVTHEDEFGPPTAIWNVPGTGPRAEYPINFPEAGRYYVHIRAFSTGTEDNGIHVGLNGDFPASGARMQFCTAGQGWSWSGRQRDSGGMGPCGAQKTIWITVEEPGEHTFMISAREDGFEIDRIMMIKDLSDNTRICKPNNADNINCVNGSLENVDDVVDMAVELERHVDTESDSEDDTGDESGDESGESDESSGTIEIDQPLEFIAVVRNRDGYDTAADVVLNMDLGLGSVWQLLDSDQSCAQEGESLVCNLGNVTPSGPEDEQVFSVQLMALQSGQLDIQANITTSSIDGSQANDSATLPINVTDASTLSEITAQLIAPTDTWVVGDGATLTLQVGNSGPADASDTQVTLVLPGRVMIASLPEGCSGTQTITCDVGTVAVGDTADLQLAVTTSLPGLYSASMSASAANMNGEVPTDSTILTANAPAASGPTDPDTDTGSTEPDTGDSGSGAGTYWLLALLSLTLLMQLYTTRSTADARSQ